MAEPTLKESYSKDLLVRFPDHYFTETAFGDSTKVEFFNVSDVLIATSTNLDVGDAYKLIREDVIGFNEDIPSKANFDLVQTTDNTETTISILPMDDESVYVVEATVIGIESDNSNRGSFRFAGTFFRTAGGNVTQADSTTLIFEHEEAPSWGGGSFDVSGTDILVRVTGATVSTINWTCKVDIVEFDG